jgi:hypothetical protein
MNGLQEQKYLGYVLSEDSFLSRIFFLQLLRAAALDRRPADRTISMHRPDDPRQTAVSDLFYVWWCRGSNTVRAKQHNHSAIESYKGYTGQFFFSGRLLSAKRKEYGSFTKQTSENTLCFFKTWSCFYLITEYRKRKKKDRCKKRNINTRKKIVHRP